MYLVYDRKRIISKLLLFNSINLTCSALYCNDISFVTTSGDCFCLRILFVSNGWQSGFLTGIWICIRGISSIIKIKTIFWSTNPMLMAVLFIGRVLTSSDDTDREDSSDWSPGFMQLYVISDKCYVFIMLRKDVVCDFVLNLPSYPCGKKIFSQRFLEKIPSYRFLTWSRTFNQITNNNK